MFVCMTSTKNAIKLLEMDKKSKMCIKNLEKKLLKTALSAGDNYYSLCVYV